MLRFHETTRRRATRTAFVLLCAAPTLGVAGWIGHSLRPGRLAHHEAALGAALRADVRLTSWHEPRPGAVRIGGLSIAAEHGASPGLTLRGVQWQGRGPDYGLTALAATLDLNQSAAWIDRGDHWWAATPSRVRLQIEQLTLTGAASETLVLQDVVVQVDPGDSTRPASLTIQGRQAAPVGGPVRLSLERRAVAGKPVVRASLDSSAGVLPVWAVGAFVPALGAAGRGALFSGFVEWEQGAVHSRGAARGELRGVDLAKVFPANSPCRAKGHAQASLAQLQWSDGQVELLQGAIRAEDVRVSRSLLDAAATRLLCGVAPLGSGPPEELVPVAKLAARFEFRPQGITLWGDFPSVAQLPEGCLALGLTGALVLQPQHRLLPVGCWVQFAAGPSGNWMPATREGVQIASGLPLPPAETAHK